MAPAPEPRRPSPASPKAAGPAPTDTVAPTPVPPPPAPTATLALADTGAPTPEPPPPAPSATTTLAVGSAKELPKWTDDFLKPSNPLDCEDYCQGLVVQVLTKLTRRQSSGTAVGGMAMTGALWQQRPLVVADAKRD